MNILGDEGERAFAELMKKNNVKTDDVSDNPEYWVKDIDFIITDRYGNERTIEVKNDACMSKTGNLYIETFNPRSIGQQGWFNFTEAEILAYEDANNKIFYFITLENLRNYINTNKQNIKIAGTPDGSKGYLVKLKEIKPLLMWETAA